MGYWSKSGLVISGERRQAQAEHLTQRQPDSQKYHHLLPDREITHHDHCGQLGRPFRQSIEGERLEVLANASGDVTLQEVQVKEFAVRSSGSGNVRVEAVKTEVFQARLSASGNVEIAGTAATLIAEVDGPGSLRAGDLQADGMDADLQASGDATVWAGDTLDVTIGGSGNLVYNTTFTFIHDIVGASGQVFD